MMTDDQITAGAKAPHIAAEIVMAAGAIGHMGNDIHSSRVWGSAALRHIATARDHLNAVENHVRVHMDAMEAREIAENQKD